VAIAVPDSICRAFTKVEEWKLPPEFLAASIDLENCFPGAILSHNKKTAASTGAHSLGRVTMPKLIVTASLFFAFTFGMTAMAVAQTMPSPKAPGTRYVLPGAAAGGPGHSIRDGRSIYRMEAPGTFYYGTDERGYPSGEPQNPRTGD
jgi:hypothetical protein